MSTFNRIALRWALALPLGLLCATALWAGNPERTGQAGATQLLINPWARSSGIGGLNSSFTTGIESQITNPAGLGSLKGTEVVFTHTLWLSGADIRINSIGLGQSLGKRGGVLGLSFIGFDLGDIERTTIDNPDGGLGTFSPTFLNISLTYGREMVENRIYVGTNIKLVHESVPDASATGIAFDAGVQYRNRSQKFKIGVTLRNIGPSMRYAGDGLVTRAPLAGSSASFDNSVAITAASFELPSVLFIGTSYDFTFGADSTGKNPQHRITPVAQFMANAFGQDQIGLGLEYSFRNLLMVRVAQHYEEGVFSEEDTQNAFTGLSAGVSVDIPLGRNSRTRFGVDYSYRHTYFFNGTHTFGARITL